MTPKRPYLLRAFYDWIVENNMTPHILVNAQVDEVTVPKQHIKEGKIVLNISPSAIHDYMLDNDALSFSARFGGVSFYIYCPINSIEAIYAREAPAEGISFSPSEYEDDTRPKAVSDDETAPALTAVGSGGSDSDQGEVGSEESEEGTQALDDDDMPPPRKRPSLRVVK